MDTPESGARNWFLVITLRSQKRDLGALNFGVYSERIAVTRIPTRIFGSPRAATPRLDGGVARMYLRSWPVISRLTSSGNPRWQEFTCSQRAPARANVRHCLGQAITVPGLCIETWGTRQYLSTSRYVRIVVSLRQICHDQLGRNRCVRFRSCNLISRIGGKKKGGRTQSRAPVKKE